MSHPGLFCCDLCPHYSARFVLIEEWMVAGCGRRPHPATIHSSISTKRAEGAEACESSMEQVRDDS